jgi:D-glycero-alpha-D-manno-heptose-7-phosphate kinase
MIISRTPLRVSLFGGGTDLSYYYSKFGGNFFSFTIDRYIYISVHSLVESSNILLKYSNSELVSKASLIKHPVFRAVCIDYKLNGIDISVSSDIPAGTGLGSSSAFTCGLINTIRVMKNMKTTPLVLAKESCRIEIDVLKEPIGIQDQYAASYGGVAKYTISKSGKVRRFSIPNYEDFSRIVKENFVLVRVKGNRDLSKIMNQQKNNLAVGKSEGVLNELNALGANSFDIVKAGPKEIGESLKYAWTLKKKLARSISNPILDGLVDEYMKTGFYGAKLLGAGSSGYLLLVGPKKLVNQIKASPKIHNLTISCVKNGSDIIYNSNLQT